MKKRYLLLTTLILLFALIGVGQVYAQDGDTGYPVETELPPDPTDEPTLVPTEAEPTVEPTLEPTVEPTVEPTLEPTEVPTEELEEPQEPDLICDGTREHPVLAGLAIRYNVDYGNLVSYFCDLDLGVGEIALALKTVQRLEGDVTLEELLALRNDDSLGWGEIWQDMGLIGNGKADQNNNKLRALTMRTVRNTNQVQNENRPDSPPGLSGDQPGNQPGPPEQSPGKGGNNGSGNLSGPSENPPGKNKP